MIPHAFSPKEFPDPDCPPHFFARGNNPQWRYFKTWSDYANRVCHLLSDGRHVATAAVVYHAEAEWTGGEYDPFEKVVKALAQRQLDCDVIPIDSLLDRNQATTSADGLRINEETYRAIIVPYSECLPEELLERLNDFACLGISVVFMRNLPRRGIAAGQRATGIIAKLEANPLVTVSGYGNLAEQLLAQAHSNRTSLIEQIIVSQKASALDIARFVADTFGYPLLDLAAFDEAHIPTDAIDRKLIATHKVIPLNKRGNRLSVAIADPTNLRALDEIRFQTGLAVDPIVVEQSKLEEPATDADARKTQLDTLRRGVQTLRELTSILGLFRAAPKADAKADDDLVGKLVQLLIEVRNMSRKNKDFATSDKVRNDLATIGILLEDRKEGTTWMRK